MFSQLSWKKRRKSKHWKGLPQGEGEGANSPNSDKHLPNGAREPASIHYISVSVACSIYPSRQHQTTQKSGSKLQEPMLHSQRKIPTSKQRSFIEQIKASMFLMPFLVKEELRTQTQIWSRAY